MLGESGSGKSALLANWVERYRQQHSDVFILAHYIGSSSDSADPHKMLRRIMAEIKAHYHLPDELPRDGKSVLNAFPEWLRKAAIGGKCILVLDALNQLDDKQHASDLAWLPEDIPDPIRLIVSSGPGKPLAVLQKRKWPSLTVRPLTAKQKKKIAIDYMEVYRKNLTDEQLQLLLQSEQSANPLFLKVILNELRVFGLYDKVEERIRYYTASNSIPELLHKVLQRFEEDYNEVPDLVRDVFCTIRASRRGLGENEIRELLGKDNDPLPQAILSPLLLAAEESLMNRSGFLTFSHDFFRQAVEKRYIDSEETKRRLFATGLLF